MTAAEMRAKAVALGLSRKGKNQYTQNAVNRLRVHEGYSDCSSFVRWCFLNAANRDIGGNTVAQITNKKLAEICLAKNGQPADEGKLLPGDLLYFMGTDASRPYRVGHVEMFVAKNRLLGHGSGLGPTEKNMKDYCANRHRSGKGLIKVLRAVTGGEQVMSGGALGQRTLRIGMSGDDVRSLQSTLIALNYSCGRWGADGEFGPATQSAVTAFQYDWHLKVDGIAGKETFLALATAQKELSDPGDVDGGVQPRRGHVEVFGGTSYVRDQPGKHGRILGVVKTGDVMAFLGIETVDGWRGVSFAGENAWHSGKYGKVVGA